MDERVKISLLLDFYGQLLTEKQRDIMDLYFNDDLSLAEISELTNTSRQAIFDIIKRCQKSLYDYENILKLEEKSETLDSNKKITLNKLILLEEDLIKSNLLDSVRKNIIDELKKDITEKL